MDRRSCGNGSKGRRLYDWVWIATASPRHQLMICRSISTGELAYYLGYVPDYYVCSMTDLVKVAGTRWAIEDDFQDAKLAVGLDETQVRGYRAWKRHTVLALAAYALLAVTSALDKGTHPQPVLPNEPGRAPPVDCGMTALTVPEIQRLLPYSDPIGHVRTQTQHFTCAGPTGAAVTRQGLAGTTTAPG
jgi:hypothetical protein